jgi:hypothetical protein
MPNYSSVYDRSQYQLIYPFPPQTLTSVKNILAISIARIKLTECLPSAERLATMSSELVVAIECNLN